MSNYELNNHKKSDKIKWIIAFVLIAVLLLGMGAMLFIPDKETEETPKEDTTVTEQKANNDFELKTLSTDNIRLMNTGITTYGADSTVSKKLVATVLPETAENKLVDWTVTWAGTGMTEPVTNYITVTPTSNGSTTATVTCKKAFTGEIIITVTTRENGYKADCIVTYLGVPTEITVSGSVMPNNGEYNVGAGQTYTFNVGLTNAFDSVASQYDYITYTVEGVGNLKLGTYQNSDGTGYWYESSIKEVSLDSLKTNFITVTYTNNVLTINTIKTIESYYGKLERIDGGRTQYYTDKFHSYVNDCYFKITLKENKSGISKVLKVRFDNTVVTGVTVSDSQLTY